ncbi:hypothetical protein ACB098_09G045300 [Castanea mollissima]
MFMNNSVVTMATCLIVCQGVHSLSNKCASKRIFSESEHLFCFKLLLRSSFSAVVRTKCYAIHPMLLHKTNMQTKTRESIMPHKNAAAIK